MDTKEYSIDSGILMRILKDWAVSKGLIVGFENCGEHTRVCIYDVSLTLKSEYHVFWSEARNMYVTFQGIIDDYESKCQSESLKYLEVGKAFAEGLEAGLKSLHILAARGNGKSSLNMYKPLMRIGLTGAFQPTIQNVIFNPPATIVLWYDGTKTVVKCDENDAYDPEKGLAMALSKRFLGNEGSYYDVFKKWLPEERYCSNCKHLGASMLQKPCSECVPAYAKWEPEEKEKEKQDG